MALQASVIVPLYIYPFVGAWDPLYQAVTAHPELTFTVVVNPHSGPGAGAMPDGNYTREIPILTSFDNVRTVGYVATDYCQKSINETLAEIQTYANWTLQDPPMQLDGIFFDETPAAYSNDSFAYLQNISTAVHDMEGLAQSIVVHNPGQVADLRYMDLADLTVVFEQTYSTWTNLSAATALAQLDYSRFNMAAMMHSVPDDIDGGLTTLVDQLSAAAGHVFVTTLDTDYYLSFSPVFAPFIDALPQKR